MKKLQWVLDKQGYQVINYSYPSLKYPIEQLAEMVITDALTQCRHTTKIHFVTHSMGGILVRLYLQDNTIEQLGSVVMLGPPNQGSPLIDYARQILGNNLFKHQAGMQLGCTQRGISQQLGRANFELGIIAGKRTVNPILSLIIGGQNDGKVSVESTKLAGMKAHITLPVTHAFMMFNNKVIQQIVHFLRKGEFLEADSLCR
ncbi:alpha/beta hydrolase [Psychromonas sp. psych-6C06]|nr:alpha/beta hydrolase [Psychromonas sp. psych-6C06]